MRIARLDAFTFPVPFRTVFRHASAERRMAQNLIVAAHSRCGATGFGEGCPRRYVTGETVVGGSGFIRDNAPSIAAEVSDIASLRGWIDGHRETIDRNPAAFCAMEIAVLDLLGQVEARAVEELVGVSRLAGSFAYSAVLGDAPYPVYRWQLSRYMRQGFADVKIKISGDRRRDRRRLLALRRPRKPLRIRLDANNLWRSADTCIDDMAALPGPVFAIEEPLDAGDIDGFREVGEACGVRIALDESLSRIEQLEELTDPGRWIVNLRVSKMGGVVRSLAVAERAARIGVGVIVGCQVGETSILARAALPVMQALGPGLVAAEGAFGTYLLRRDLVSASLRFGRGGVLAAEDVPNNGLGGLGMTFSTRHLQRPQ